MSEGKPTLYDNIDSGNCYKARLTLALTGTDYHQIEIDTETGQTRTPEFFSLNPDGRVPVLTYPDGRVLPESNAIVFHLARATDYWPNDPWEQAQVLRWLFYEQYSHEPNVAVARHWMLHGSLTPDQERQLKEKQEKGRAALNVMNEHLAEHHWHVGAGPTIADIALFAYTHVADDGGIALSPFVNVRSWIDRIQTLPGFVAMKDVEG